LAVCLGHTAPADVRCLVRPPGDTFSTRSTGPKIGILAATAWARATVTFPDGWPGYVSGRATILVGDPFVSGPRA